jgi:hypothetical protein
VDQKEAYRAWDEWLMDKEDKLYAAHAQLVAFADELKRGHAA